MKDLDFSIKQSFSLKLKVFLTSILLSFIICAILLVLGALIITYVNTSLNLFPIVAFLIILISCFCGSFFCSRKIGSMGLIYGIIFGIIFFVIIYLIGFFSFDAVKFDLIILLRFITTAIVGGVGGILGVNFKKKKK